MPSLTTTGATAISAGAGSITTTGAVSAASVTATGLTAARALVTTTGGLLATSATTATELGYVSGVTSAIQTQFTTVNSAIALKAPIAGPTFTGTVTAGAISAASLTTTGDITVSGNLSAGQVFGTTLGGFNVSTIPPTLVASGGYNNSPYASFTRASTQYANAGPQTFTMNGTGFTVIAHVQFTGTAGSYERVLDFGTGPNASKLYLSRVGITAVARCQLLNSSGTVVASIDAGTIVQGNWTVLAMTITSGSAGVMTLYQDNVSVGTATSTGTTNLTCTDTFIGKSEYTDAYLNGGVRYLGTWNRTLSTTELTTAYTALTKTTASSPTPFASAFLQFGTPTGGNIVIGGNLTVAGAYTLTSDGALSVGATTVTSLNAGSGYVVANFVAAGDVSTIANVYAGKHVIALGNVTAVDGIFAGNVLMTSPATINMSNFVANNKICLYGSSSNPAASNITGIGLQPAAMRLNVMTGNSVGIWYASETFPRFKFDPIVGSTYTEYENSGYSSTMSQLTANVLYTGNLFNFIACRAGANTATAANVFRVRGDGTVYGVGAFQTSGADYAEYFEWADGNPDAQDRVGITVALGSEGKIVQTSMIANVDPANVIGVVSSMPSVVGDSAWSHWKNMYLTDDFGRPVTSNTVTWTWTDPITGLVRTCPASDPSPDAPDIGNVTVVETSSSQPTVNPAYDPDSPYVPREERKEWACVGLVGKIRVRSDQIVGSRWFPTKVISPNVTEYLVR